MLQWLHFSSSERKSAFGSLLSLWALLSRSGSVWWIWLRAVCSMYTDTCKERTKLEKILILKFWWVYSGSFRHILLLWKFYWASDFQIGCASAWSNTLWPVTSSDLSYLQPRAVKIYLHQNSMTRWSLLGMQVLLRTCDRCHRQAKVKILVLLDQWASSRSLPFPCLLSYRSLDALLQCYKCKWQWYCIRQSRAGAPGF